MSYRCPACQLVIYNRRLFRCDFCGEDIPASLRFTDAEIAALDKMVAEAEVVRKFRESEQDKLDEERDRMRRDAC